MQADRRTLKSIWRRLIEHGHLQQSDGEYYVRGESAENFIAQVEAAIIKLRIQADVLTGFRREKTAAHPER